MSTKPSDILDLAKDIHARSGNEAAYRSAISRSYYAALLRVDEVIPNRNAPAIQPNESSHSKIIGRVDVYRKGANPGRTEAAKIYQLLPRMRRDRVTADYFLNEEVSATNSAEALVRSEAVMQYCDDLVRKIGV